MKSEKSSPLFLGKYIATAGYCSRRKAVEFIKNGKVLVNNKPQLDPTYIVKPTDKVIVHGTLITPAKKIHLLYNKPKDIICTLDDPQERSTIAQVFKEEFQERLYPIGRLDRATTGLIIMTNDGQLAQTLSHPSYEIEKVYQVTTAQTLKAYDVNKLLEGVELEDGLMVVDEISFPTTKRTICHVAVHSGKNRIIRRLFESLGHTVVKLDRIRYAGLSKQKLAVGEYRHLTGNEIDMLAALCKQAPTKPEGLPVKKATTPISRKIYSNRYAKNPATKEKKENSTGVSKYKRAAKSDKTKKATSARPPRSTAKTSTRIQRNSFEDEIDFTNSMMKTKVRSKRKPTTDTTRKPRTSRNDSAAPKSRRPRK